MGSALTSAGSTRRWRLLRAAVLERDGHRCRIAGDHCTGEATTVDHIRPRHLGGDDSVANLRAACEPCNAERRLVPREKTRRESRW